mmetsp:Transcript_29037/g.83916  ORF Transcript_29037/g.83916 Transcript_29037/m.83916 type:complete len:221 (+) Transcript_29037:192-854(+)
MPTYPSIDQPSLAPAHPIGERPSFLTSPPSFPTSAATPTASTCPLPPGIRGIPTPHPHCRPLHRHTTCSRLLSASRWRRQTQLGSRRAVISRSTFSSRSTSSHRLFRHSMGVVHTSFTSRRQWWWIADTTMRRVCSAAHRCRAFCRYSSPSSGALPSASTWTPRMGRRGRSGPGAASSRPASRSSWSSSSLSSTSPPCPLLPLDTVLTTNRAGCRERSHL